MDHLELNKDQKTIIGYLLKKQCEHLNQFEEIQRKMVDFLDEIKCDDGFNGTKIGGVVCDLTSFVDALEINNNKILEFNSMIKEELNQEK